MRIARGLFVAVAVSLGFAAGASAASLQIAPVGFDLPAASKVAQLTLHNLGTAPLNAQIRVFRWSQAGGQDQLTETQDIVASPPAVTIEPGLDHLVRLVRVAAAPVAGEESYRLLVDELAPPPDPNTTGITFVVRYSVPVFFHDAGAQPNPGLVRLHRQQQPFDFGAEFGCAACAHFGTDRDVPVRIEDRLQRRSGGICAWRLGDELEQTDAGQGALPPAAPSRSWRMGTTTPR